MSVDALLKARRVVVEGLVLAALTSASAFGQTGGTPRILVAADIQLAKAGSRWTSVGVLPDGYVRVRNASVRQLVAAAYGIGDSAVTGGPAWVDVDRFDIVAGLAPSPKDSVLSRLQKLLAERFTLVLRHVPRRDSLFALTVAKDGSMLRPSADPGAAACPAVPGVQGQIHRACKAFAMSDLADLLPRVAAAYITLPVVDRTGLTGTYDFQIDWMGRAPHDAAIARMAAGGAPEPLAVSVFEAVAKIGLSLDRREVLTDAIVIESAARVPMTRLVTGAHAAPTRKELTPGQLGDIDRYVADQMKKDRVPGVAVGVYRRGDILLAKGYGLANLELNVPVNPATIFQSGSVGKQFVSAAIMMLVEDGKIGLDESITKYFPDAPDWWKPILVKNLLSHTSGLAEYEGGERSAPSGPFYLRLDFTEAELVKKVEMLPMEAKAGDLWNYRNTNYLLLGIMIHKITGKPYADVLQERLFGPWNMNATRLISESAIVPNRSSGYEPVGRQGIRNQDWVSPTFNSTGDGTLYFNVLDLAKWDEALYGTSLLKQSSLDHLWTVFPLNDGKPNPGRYGFGWTIATANGHKVIEHSGGWQGFTAHISRYVDDTLTVVVLTNFAVAQPTLMAHTIAGLVNSALAPPVPKVHVAVTMEPKIVDGYVGSYQLAPNVVMSVTRAGARLFTQLTGQDPVEIFPESPRDFFLRVVDAQLTFITDDAGKATEVILHQGGRDQHAKRILPP
ncbi:MAG: TIGR03435 family protein [bacterium]